MVNDSQSTEFQTWTLINNKAVYLSHEPWTAFSASSSPPWLNLIHLYCHSHPKLEQQDLLYQETMRCVKDPIEIRPPLVRHPSAFLHNHLNHTFRCFKIASYNDGALCCNLWTKFFCHMLLIPASGSICCRGNDTSGRRIYNWNFRIWLGW